MSCRVPCDVAAVISELALLLSRPHGSSTRHVSLLPVLRIYQPWSCPSLCNWHGASTLTWDTVQADFILFDSCISLIQSLLIEASLTSPFKYATHSPTPHSGVSLPCFFFFFLKHCCLLSYHIIYSVMIFIIYCLSPKECSNPQKGRFALFCS